MFRFEDQYTMFDVTPVDNLFILEHMPGAQGDHVKVYLYGLMQCYHPQQEANIERMGQELNMSEEDILAAYRYWERRGLVHRVSDHPVAFRYVNAKKLMLTAEPTDPVYDAFSQAVHLIFDNKRKIYGKEVSRFYEWVEQLGLSQEVVLRLLERLIEIRGPRFTMELADKRATELADAGAMTAEDVDVLMNRDKQVIQGCRDVIAKLQMKRAATVPEMDMYQKWLVEWGYTPDAILQACDDTTNGRQPSFKYLDTILENRRHSGAPRDDKGLRKLLRELNLPGVTVNDSTLAEYAKMLEMYPEPIILLAGKECAKRGCSLEDVGKTLKAWQGKGLKDEKDIAAYMAQVGQYNDFVDELYQVWGKTSRSSAANRTLVQKWLGEWGLSKEMVVYCAGMAKEAERPMPYLNSILDGFRKQGIVAPEAAAAADTPKPQKQGKVVREQQYTQREYTDGDALPEWMQQQIKEMNGGA